MPDRENYEIYASGSIFYAMPGHPAFPVRLASEIFRRCMAIREASGASDPCILYDPCCGSAYHLATIAYFNWGRIAQIHGSDIDADALSVAGRNLSLLDQNGLDRRINELSAMAQQFGKSSHETALNNARFLKQELTQRLAEHPITTQIFRADATDSAALQTAWNGTKIDMVITDVPYGQQSHWQFDTHPSNGVVEPLKQMLDALLPILDSKAVVAVATNKQDKITHERYKRAEKFQVGKRQIVILRPIS